MTLHNTSSPKIPALTKTGTEFPPVTHALKEPNGLLAKGGALTSARLIAAYRQGIFPWYNPGEPILWWSPDPRAVLFPQKLKLSKSAQRALKKRQFQMTFDHTFFDVIQKCSEVKRKEPGTWITPEMITAYSELHRQGFAHSIEVWEDGRLIGGLYGVQVGRVFSGESMFSEVPNASKAALVYLVNRLPLDHLVDCQVMSEHLLSLGAQWISRDDFLTFLR